MSQDDLITGASMPQDTSNDGSGVNRKVNDTTGKKERQR